jgi:hypothetical protein
MFFLCSIRGHGEPDKAGPDGRPRHRDSDGRQVRPDRIADITPSDIVDAVAGGQLDALYPPKLCGPRGLEILRVAGPTDRRSRVVNRDP